MKQRTKGRNGHAERSPDETLGKELIVEHSFIAVPGRMLR